MYIDMDLPLDGTGENHPLQGGAPKTAQLGHN